MVQGGISLLGDRTSWSPLSQEVVGGHQVLLRGTEPLLQPLLCSLSPGVHPIQVPLSVSPGCRNGILWIRGLQKQALASHGSGGRKSKIKVPGGLVSW